MRAFDGPARAGRDTRDWLAELEPFTARWDFRAGRERDLADGSALAPEHNELVLKAAAELGMQGSWPPDRAHYDTLVILGGLVTAAVARPAFAAELLGGGVGCDRIVALGAYRPLGSAELETSAALMHPDITDELHAMDWGVRAAFGLDGPIRRAGRESGVIGEGWAILEYAGEDGTRIDVIAAPSSAPGVRRANTADTYAWLATKTPLLAPGAHVLIVTTQIYWPFQTADAWRMLRLPHDVHVEIVGMVPSEVDPRLQQTFEAHKYLQETRSAISAMRKLYAAAVAH